MRAIKFKEQTCSPPPRLANEELEVNVRVNMKPMTYKMAHIKAMATMCTSAGKTSFAILKHAGKIGP